VSDKSPPDKSPPIKSPPDKPARRDSKALQGEVKSPPRETRRPP